MMRDTVVLNCDLGFRLNLQVKARLYGINAPEMRGLPRAEGIEAKGILQDIIGDYQIGDEEDPPHPWLLIETRLIPSQKLVNGKLRTSSPDGKTK